MSTKTARTIAENFIAYLNEEGIGDLLPEVASLLDKEADRRNIITVMSAETLTEKEQADLCKTLTAKWGERDVEFAVDSTLLSGMIIAFKDQIIDMSGRNALTDLSQHLS